MSWILLRLRTGNKPVKVQFLCSLHQKRPEGHMSLREKLL
nr:MAG TPA: hypothetical protein [Bacteriophage sp.]